jgi:hypothetical protein
MFPDDSDEDVDNLDDTELLESFLRPAQAATRADAEATVPDWPSADATDTIFRIDPATLDWFKSHHADWRREIRLVLRAWISTRTNAASAAEREAERQTFTNA